MAEKKQTPLAEVLFGQEADPTIEPESSLAQVISACYREGLAQSLRDQAAQRSSLPDPAAGEVKS